LEDAQLTHTSVAPASSMLRVLDIDKQMIRFHRGERIFATAPHRLFQVGERLGLSDPRLRSVLEPIIARRARSLSNRRWAASR